MITIGGDLTVRRLGFGAMRITGPGTWGPPADRGQAIAVLRRAVAAGVNFIDTADSYGPNVSEELIAEALHPYPAGLVIATKGGLTRPGPARWESNAHPEHLRAALDGSLKRLRLERIDLYQLHRPDPAVPLAESLGALVEAQRAGKIRHIGISNVSVAELDEARRHATIVSVQNRYNAEDLSSEDVLRACERDRLPFMPWAPLDRGGKLASLATLAQAHGVTTQQMGIAWLLHRSPMMLVIPGTGNLAHLEENLAAAEIELSDDEVRSVAA
jgi:aryl-alcohol dehydrogenase-like predicted oxidoreductase